MGRPRRPFNGVETVEFSHDKWLLSLTPGGLGTREKRRRMEQTHWTYPTINGIYDPLTYLHILDTLANINPDIELRASNLTEFLNEKYPDWLFDAISVGKVLAELREYIEDVLGEKRGLLEKGQDYKGVFYRIHHNQETARLYHALRADLVRLAEFEVDTRRVGKTPKRLATPLLECPSVRVGYDLALDA